MREKPHGSIISMTPKHAASRVFLNFERCQAEDNNRQVRFLHISIKHLK